MYIEWERAIYSQNQQGLDAVIYFWLSCSFFDLILMINTSVVFAHNKIQCKAHINKDNLSHLVEQCLHCAIAVLIQHWRADGVLTPKVSMLYADST